MNSPHRHKCSGDYPLAYTEVILVFRGGARHPGYWTGVSWIANGFAVSPLEWESIPKEIANDPAVESEYP